MRPHGRDPQHRRRPPAAEAAACSAPTRGFPAAGLPATPPSRRTGAALLAGGAAGRPPRPGPRLAGRDPPLEGDRQKIAAGEIVNLNDLRERGPAAAGARRLRQSRPNGRSPRREIWKRAHQGRLPNVGEIWQRIRVPLGRDRGRPAPRPACASGWRRRAPGRGRGRGGLDAPPHSRSSSPRAQAAPRGAHARRSSAPPSGSGPASSCRLRRRPRRLAAAAVPGGRAAPAGAAAAHRDRPRR